MSAFTIEDRLAIQDLIVAYGDAVDRMESPETVAELFVEDGVFDLSDIGVPAFSGRAAIRDFFVATFAHNTHHFHALSNFALTRQDGDSAQMTCYVIGMGISHDGSKVTVHGRYVFDVTRTGQGWKATRYALQALMPIMGSTDHLNN
ncbi:nuclear transport factor 2 family protein [Novosphingobium ovatum]|uniref:nuclear transport factor 2 family protein n=1 Tax=Novosphingobium ovatum TaxID=1908523 RepID=UPI0029FF2F29|nr:nuclear transport factor 2 family protein [Novosphingobium ovatum]